MRSKCGIAVMLVVHVILLIVLTERAGQGDMPAVLALANWLVFVSAYGWWEAWSNLRAWRKSLDEFKAFAESEKEAWEEVSRIKR